MIITTQRTWEARSPATALRRGCCWYSTRQRKPCQQSQRGFRQRLPHQRRTRLVSQYPTERPIPPTQRRRLTPVSHSFFRWHRNTDRSSSATISAGINGFDILCNVVVDAEYTAFRRRMRDQECWKCSSGSTHKKRPAQITPEYPLFRRVRRGLRSTRRPEGVHTDAEPAGVPSGQNQNAA